MPFSMYFPLKKQQQLFSNIFKSAGTVLQYLQYCFFFALTFLLNPDPKQIIPMPDTRKSFGSDRIKIRYTGLIVSSS